MSPPPSPQLLARRRRTLRIRQVVGGVAVAIFLALFATIYVQLAAGNDPALTAAAPKTTAARVTTAPAPVKTSTSSGSSASTGTSTSSTSSSPAPVTTQQS